MKIALGIREFESLLQREASRDFSIFDRMRHYLASLFAKKPLMDFDLYKIVEKIAIIIRTNYLIISHSKL
jgi:hypothetical protein